MRSRGVFSTIGFLALCLVVITLLNEWDGSLPSDASEAQLAPLIIAENITGKTFTPNGQIEYLIHAQQLLEKDADNTTELTLPDVYIYQQQDSPAWHITSHQAKYTGALSELILTGEVIAKQLEGEPLSIESDTITYLSKQERISTNQPVLIKQGPNTTTAGGMQADAKTGILNLLNRVESRYAAP